MSAGKVSSSSTLSTNGRRYLTPVEEIRPRKRLRTDEPDANGAATTIGLDTVESIASQKRTSSATSPALAKRAVSSRTQLREPRSPSCRPVTDIIPRPVTEPFVLQSSSCQRYTKLSAQFEPCQACISRKFHSGECKFTNLRAFRPGSETGAMTAFDEPMFLDSAPILGRKRSEASRIAEIEYSTPGSAGEIAFLRSSIAPTLRDVLFSELEFENEFRGKLLRRRREAGVRPVCDGCATTIFMGHFMCCACGRELCIDCYCEWDDGMETGFENVDSCSRRRKHTKGQMIPYTFANLGELLAISEDVDSFSPGEQNFVAKEFSREHADGLLAFIKVNLNSITEQDFRSLWSMSHPIVVTGCLDKFQIAWTPDYFISHYGEQSCQLVDCNSDKMIKTTVGKFFEQFHSTNPKEALKLKVSSY
jgi:hypothetical protein